MKLHGHLTGANRIRPTCPHQYPQVIAEIEFKILNASCQLEIQTEQIGFMDGEIEVEIAISQKL